MADDEPEFIPVTYGSYRLSDGSFKDVDTEETHECIAIEIEEQSEAVMFLSRLEAQQLITNLYKALNK